MEMTHRLYTNGIIRMCDWWREEAVEGQKIGVAHMHMALDTNNRQRSKMTFIQIQM